MLSGALHIRFNDVELIAPSLKFISEGYRDDEFRGPLIKVLNTKLFLDPVKMKKFEKLATQFNLNDNKLIYEGNFNDPINSANTALHIGHDCNIAGPFGYYKTLYFFVVVYSYFSLARLFQNATSQSQLARLLDKIQMPIFLCDLLHFGCMFKFGIFLLYSWL